MSDARDRLADIEARLGGSSQATGPRRTTHHEGGPGWSRPLPPGVALLPLRLFLGVTFVYAGVQKLSDPGFLQPGAPTYIGTQLHQFAHGTPGGFILRTFAFPRPGLAGVGVAVVEIAVGLMTISGLLTRVAAFVGLCVNLLLFLTNSWNTYPYFLGSDIVFVFAWMPLVMAGASGQPALDHVAAEAAERRGRSPGSETRALGMGGASADRETVTRRTLITRGLGATAVLTGVIAGLASLAKGTYHTSSSAKTLRAARGGAHSAAKGARTPGAGPLPAGARNLGPASRLPTGEAAYYRDPANGDPDILVRQPGGALSAHSAICTHAGCTVQYSGGELVCPCHGSIFNAATGAVIQGPAVAPLPARRVIARGGRLYSVPT